MYILNREQKESIDKLALLAESKWILSNVEDSCREAVFFL